MFNINNVVSSIDWNALQTQKLNLLHLTDIGHDTPDVWAIIHMIDALQDAAIEDGVVSEEDAFQFNNAS
jgi:hypothetical protein